MKRSISTIIAGLLISAAGAYAQSDVSNIIDTGLPEISDVVPAGGLTNDKRLVFQGTVTDTTGSGADETISGIRRVEYRTEHGKWQWRR